MSLVPEINEDEFRELCEHVGRLRRLAELSYRFHYEGLSREELRELLILLRDLIEHSVRNKNIPLLQTLSWFIDHLERFVPPRQPITFRRLREVLPPDPLFPVAFGIRRLIRGFLDLPPPPTLREVLDEFDVLVSGFIDELMRHTRTLVALFKVMRPESIPWIIKFIEKNPGHVRTTLGEPLAIWWLGNVLSKFKPIWSATRGPIVVDKTEIDAVSVSARSRQFAIAEVKVTKDKKQFKKAYGQIVRAIKLLSNTDVIRRAGFTWVKTPCKPSEAVIITLYRLGKEKDCIRKEFKEKLESNGINIEAYVYDIKDIKNSLKKVALRHDLKERYEKLFETIENILEKTYNKEKDSS